MDFRSLLQTGEYVLLDGAMGTMLQGKGMPMGAVPEMMNLLHPEWLVEIHRRYIEAGARVVYANTFGASPYKAQGCGHSPEELIAAIEDPKCYVPRVITVPGEIQPGGSVRDLTLSEISEKE